MKREALYTIPTSCARQTKRFAVDFAKQIANTPPKKHATILALKGDLGSGKTTFVQGLAQGFGVKAKVLSPTFLIIKRFQVSGSRFHDFYHVDCYRLKSERELLQLGWKEIMQDPQNIVAVEWADRVKKIIPKHALWLCFSHTGKQARKILLQ